MKYLLYKGCNIPIKYPNLEKLALELLPEIGIDLADDGQFSCCPDPVQIQGVNTKFWYAAAARNLAIAEEQNLNIATTCNGCLNTLAIVNHKLKSNDKLKASVNELLKEIGMQYKGTIEVKHFMQVIKDDVGMQNLKKYVKKPLNGLKIAAHPGCHLLMPAEIIKFDDPADPVVFDKFIGALGATPVDYVSKILCCGVSLALAGAKDSVNELLKKKLLDIKSAGADLITTACSSCLTQFDMGQLVAARSVPELKASPVPVTFTLEVLGLAMGKSLADIGASTHKIPLNINL